MTNLNLTKEGCDWLLACTIPKILDSIRVHLVVDLPDTGPRSDADVNIFLSIEPPAIRGDVHSRLRDPSWCSQWDIIGCADPSIIVLPEKARKYVHSPFWIDPCPPTPKIFGVSTIMSSKKFAEGHRMRHWFRDNWKIKIPSKIFHGKQRSTSPDAIFQPYPQDRRECFQMMFHLTIENCRSPGYYTEKLMDCFRSRSVPIYWGDPNIGEVFDTSGMILISDMCGPQIRHMISNLTPEDYEKRKESIESNFIIAERLCEGHNPDPRDSIPPAMCNRLGVLIREAQEKFLRTR